MTEDGQTKSTPIAGRLARLLRLARSHGKMRALYRGVRGLAEAGWWRRGVNLCVVEVFTAAVSELRCGPAPRAFVVRPARPDDLPALQSFCTNSSDVDQRFARGDICFITLAGDRICAAVWLAVGPCEYHGDGEELGCMFRIPSHAGLTYDGKGTKWGAWGSLMACLPRHLEGLNISRLFTLIDCDNPRSLDSHKSLGYRPVGFIGCLRILGGTFAHYRAHGTSWRTVPGQIEGLSFSRADESPTASVCHTVSG